MSMVKTKLNGAYEIIIPKHRADRPEWYTAEGWEKKRLRRLRQEIQSTPNPVVYYVGAEEGEMPALCSMWGANVFLFEPNEKVLPNIRAIWEANGLKDCTVFKGFAGNETNPENFELSAIETIEGEVIGNHGFKELHDKGEIPVVKIDDIAEMCVKPTLITMDVEGSEFEVLKGAEKTIREHKPVILLSLHPEFLIQYWNVYGAEVRQWVKDFGYDEELLDYKHEVHLIYTPREGNNGENTPANA